MELIRGSYNLRPEHRGCAATIGNFDGVHLGHAAVFRHLAERAAQLRLPACAITFEPLPQEYFAGERAPARLLRLAEKLRAIKPLGMDRLLLLKFNDRLARLSADAFIEQILVDGLGVRHLVVGDDFRFGCNREGDFARLQDAGRRFGFEVADTQTVDLGGERVSSTRIRALLMQGELEAAARLLGRPYQIAGRVAHGDKRGRQIGFPTANLHLRRRSCPLNGVYAVRATIENQEVVEGVANLGRRPTVNGEIPLLEVHLFNFNRDLYTRHLCVDFLHKIRDERRFSSLDALVAQIGEDAAQARSYLRQTGAVV